MTEHVFTWLYRQYPYIDRIYFPNPPIGRGAFTRWDVADNWWYGEWDGPGPYDPNAPGRDVLTNVGLEHRAPGPDDTVVFGKVPPSVGYPGPGYSLPGFVGGGGSAARLLINNDDGEPIRLGGGTFGTVDLHGTAEFGSVNARRTHIDELSKLGVGPESSLGEVTIDATGSLVVRNWVHVASVDGDAMLRPIAEYNNPTGPPGGIYADLDQYPEPLRYQPAQGGAEYGRVVLGAESHAAQALRLYGAALDRLPDRAGLEFWTDAARDGQPLSALAEAFLGSAEFRARPGGEGAGNGAFVDRLYLDVLGRVGEADGLGFWAAAFDNGASRAEVLAAFSESAENKAATAALGQRGVWLKGEDAAQLTRLYDTLLDRLPDAEGFFAWRGELGSGRLSLGEVADALLASAEFRAGHGGLDDMEFARLLYRNALDRAPDEAGLDDWVGRLGAGAARSAVALAFSESDEHVWSGSAGLDRGASDTLFA